jgi:hypothetical protein
MVINFGSAGRIDSVGALCPHEVSNRPMVEDAMAARSLAEFHAEAGTPW